MEPNSNGEFRGAVKAEIKGLEGDVSYIRERIDKLPCTDCLSRLSAVETRVKTVSSVFGTIAGVVSSVVAIMVKSLLGK